MFAKLQRIVLALVLCLSSVSCTSCAKKTPEPTTPDANPAPTVTVTPEPPVPVVTTVTVKQDSLELTLPSTEWVAVQNPPPQAQAWLNLAKKNGVVIVSEDYTGSFESYVLYALRGVKDSGGLVVAAKQVTINGNTLVLVESTKNTIHVWMWVALVNGKGYGVSCGGPADPSQQDLCNGIASTIKISK